MHSDCHLTVTVLLAIVPFISATSQSPGKGVRSRDLAVQQRDSELPEGWFSLGCYTDSPAQRTLTSLGFTDSRGMTVELCVNACNNLKHIYAGVENGKDCYCGDVLTVGATNASSSDCSFKCVGNPAESCGNGSDRINLYWSDKPPPPQPTFVPNVGGWVYNGCFDDFNDGRTLRFQAFVEGGPNENSVESCVSACEYSGYRLAGVEFAKECWCDHTINWFAQRIATTHCMLACPGNSSEICGGANSLVMYFNRGRDDDAR